MKKSITTHERNMCKDSSSNEEISTPQNCTTFHYKCDLCKSNFSSEKIIRHHLKCHKEIYKCNQCKVMFASLKEVIEHFQDLHSRCRCDLCGKEYVSKKRLIRHMLVHEKQECIICHREFVTRTKLLRHNYNVHGLYIKKKAGPPNLEEAYCVECDKQFSSAPALKKHLYSSVRHGGYKQKSVPCPECGKVFVRRGYMENHRRLFHSRDDRHRCDACGKRFVSAFTVRQHRERVHERRAPPRDKLCADCGRGFATNRILIQHIRTHTGERPFACPQCPARFRQKYSAQTHFRSQHAGKDDALPVLAP